MTLTEFKEKVSEQSPYYFSRKTMKFFGDTMKNYGIRTIEHDGEELWELYRKKPVKHGLQSSAYFSKDTYQKVFVNEKPYYSLIKGR